MNARLRVRRVRTAALTGWAAHADTQAVSSGGSTSVFIVISVESECVPLLCVLEMELSLGALCAYTSLVDGTAILMAQNINKSKRCQLAVLCHYQHER